MKPHPANDIGDGTLLDLHADAVPLRLPAGSAIFACTGVVWITQERLRDDVILRPGERFEVRSRELILASASDGAAKIWIASPVDAAAGGDVYALLRARAARLRREALRDAMAALRGRKTKLMAHIKRALEPSRRLARH